MVDIQPVAAEIRRRKKKKKQDENIMACPIPYSGHKKTMSRSVALFSNFLLVRGHRGHAWIKVTVLADEITKQTPICHTQTRPS